MAMIAIKIRSVFKLNLNRQRFCTHYAFAAPWISSLIVHTCSVRLLAIAGVAPFSASCLRAKLYHATGSEAWQATRQMDCGRESFARCRYDCARHCQALREVTASRSQCLKRQDGYLCVDDESNGSR